MRTTLADRSAWHPVGRARRREATCDGVLHSGNGVAGLADVTVCRADGSDQDRVARAFVTAAIRLAPALLDEGGPSLTLGCCTRGIGHWSGDPACCLVEPAGSDWPSRALSSAIRPASSAPAVRGAQP